MKKILAPQLWKRLAVVALLSAAAATALLVCHSHSAPASPIRTARFETLSSLPLDGSSGVQLDHAAQTISTDTKPSLVLGSFPISAVNHLILRVQAESPFSYSDFVLHYQPNGDQQQPPASYHTARGVPNAAGTELTVVWHLPTAIDKGILYLPEHAALRFQSLELTCGPDRETLDLLPPGQTTCKFLAIAFVAWVMFLTVQQFWPSPGVNAILVKKVLIVGLIPAYGSMIFLLPPFQGPDEDRHWKDALGRYRHDPLQEIVLYNLPDLLGTDTLPFRTANHYSAVFLRKAPAERCPDPVVDRITYTTTLTYPFVAPIAWLVPRAQTMREALLFYYLCRILPVAVLFIVLWLANRQGQLPYTALVFLSFPLVMQQFTVISSDTAPNLGTLIAALLFARGCQHRDRKLVLCLWLLCALITLAKPPIYAGMLLLPLMLTPLGGILRSKVFLSLAITGLLVGLMMVYFGWERWLEWFRHPAPPPLDPETQLRLLGSHRGQMRFLRASCTVLTDLLQSWQGWFQPLGWLDTALSAYHQQLIILSILAAIPFDILEYAPGWWAGARTRAWQTAKILVVAAVIVLSMAFGVCFLMYVWATPPWTRHINFQVRYFFPAALLLLFVHVAILPNRLDQSPLADQRVSVRRLLHGAALSLFPLLWVARQIELTVDLLARYW